MALKFCTSVTKGLKVKFRKLWGLISTLVEVTGEKLGGGLFCSPPILHRVNLFSLSCLLSMSGLNSELKLKLRTRKA